MDHLDLLRSIDKPHSAHKALMRRATGRYYTHALIGQRLASVVWHHFESRDLSREPIRIIDPFGGDGRLAFWLIQHVADATRNQPRWDVTLWDIDEQALESAQGAFRSLVRHRPDLRVSINCRKLDAFSEALHHEHPYDIVLTNPPWDVLKPDRREIEGLPEALRTEYIASLARYSAFLTTSYPISKPQQRFGGWTTQLSRVGTEVALRLLAPGGIAGIIVPSSLLADDASRRLREHLFRELTVHDVAYYPAEMRLFGKADIASAALVMEGVQSQDSVASLTRFGAGGIASVQQIHIRRGEDVTFPVAFGHAIPQLQQRLKRLPSWADLEQDHGLWAGRELDETNLSSKLAADGVSPFLKGRMVTRMAFAEAPSLYVREASRPRSGSIGHERVVWRDVSRPNQKRRIIATLAPSGWITGNSLGVAYFDRNNSFNLRGLLALMSSLVFEYQLRSILSTGHVSLTALRKVRLPIVERSPLFIYIAATVDRILGGERSLEPCLEAASAFAYGVSREELESVAGAFGKLTSDEVKGILLEFDRQPWRKRD